jgi:CRISPR-associated endonuclease/helicase Cas3
MESRGVDFDSAFEALTGHSPMSWQRRLFEEHFATFDRENYTLPPALDIPTGLGKTSVMAIWYIARKTGAPVPRRLVYVVDRRAVVDQATEVANQLKDQDGELRVSTLRGRFTDNRDWLENPAGSAIIVGTVDMIGSRLLFSGYGVSAKMRPYHAGLLGADALVVLDEAHLVPPFEALLKAIARDRDGVLGPARANGGQAVPRLHLMSLSATGRTEGEADATNVFELSEEDRKHPLVQQRLNAEKRLTLHEAKDAKAPIGELADRAWNLATKPAPGRVIVFCNSREDAQKVKDEIDKRAKKEKIDAPWELLVGERRVHERENLSKWLKDHGFIDGADEPPKAPTFLVATSAGEVGVDLDADHMVCDLVEWERMVQRLGRVNRRGGEGRTATVEIVAAPPKSEKKGGEKWPDRLKRLSKPIEALNGGGSPAAIVALKKDANLKGALENAQTPAPLRPALTRALVDAWSMTSLDEHTGRPDIRPWLRGWVDEDEPQTTIVWRRYLPARNTHAWPSKTEIDGYFDAAPPQTSEMLEARRWGVAEWLIARAVRAADMATGVATSDALSGASAVLFALNRKQELDEGPWTLDQLAGLAHKENKREREAFEQKLTGRVLVVSSRLGGLSSDGMLSENCDGEPSTIDNEEAWKPAPPFRLRETDDAAPATDADWRETYRFAAERSEYGDETRWLVVERREAAQSEDARAIARFEQTLSDHQGQAERIARDLAKAFTLPSVYADALALAARLHDEGKQTQRWQRAFRAPTGHVYAKTKGPIDFNLLDGYRHEFGSLPHVENDPDFQRLPADLKDLVLHLVAAHHGGARPVISTRGCAEAPPSTLHLRAREVALRFARLQKRWGPWGLTWWEALLRAADQQASRDESGNGGEDR